MTPDSTLTQTRTNTGVVREARPTATLTVVLHCHDLSLPPSRHLLRDTDTVEVGRGDAAPARATIDRRRGLRLSLADRQASSTHFALRRDRGRWVVVDAGSKNGTLLNGEPVETAALADGDVIEAGRTLLVFRDQAEVPVEAELDVVGPLPGAPAPEWSTTDDALQWSFRRASAVARSTAAITLQGETGTGKEVAARVVHRLSGRSGACVAVNCAAIPKELIEAELFGHRAGAFSGATGARDGWIRSADRGTLFLDEIGDLPPASQGALLRTLETRQVVPVGGDRPIDVDFRLLTATHVDLGAAVAAGRFRADLRARLGAMTLTLPPLRERRADLGLLIRALSERLGYSGALTIKAGRALLLHDWPGNVRELFHVLEAAALQSDGALIDAPHLPPLTPRQPADLRADAPLDAAESAERDELIALLVSVDGNVAEVCRQLDVHRVTLYRRFRRLGIEPAEHRGR